MGKIFAVINCVVILTLALPTVTFATADPDAPPACSYFYVNRHLLETNDFLFFVIYQIPYAATPAEAINETYLFRFIDDDGVTELGAVTAYPYATKGYGYGVVAFYFDAAHAPTWGANHILRISQSPVNFATPESWDFIIPTNAYTALSSQSGNQAQVATRILTMTGVLETQWATTLTSQQDTGTVLAFEGEDYYRNTIPGLQSMAPALFFIQVGTVDTTKRVWGTGQSDIYKNLLNGTWIRSAFDGVADWINIPTVLMVGIITVGLCVYAISKSKDKFSSPAPGYVASVLVVMCAGMLFLGLTTIALIAFLVIILGGMLIFQPFR